MAGPSIARQCYCRVLWSALAVWLSFAGLAGATALDDYIAAPDAHYAFTLAAFKGFDESTYTFAYVLNLTSQAWRDASEVDQPVWQHRVIVIVPDTGFLRPPAKDTALLLIDGGDTGDPAPSIDPALRQLAGATRAVVVQLSAVPNQPLLFADEITPRSEDEIIAYSWDKFIQTGDSTWPAQLPMVNAVVRCMDAVQDFVRNDTEDRLQINHFVPVGGSKRGWTAWLTAAVDSRVTALAPIVSDLLNMRLSFAHHFAAYGFWADALSPYEDLGIFDWLDTAEATALLQIVDPFSYRDRLTMPKFIINAAGDDFFVLDSDRFYVHDLAGETYLRHLPNANHYLTGVYDQVVNGAAPYLSDFLEGRRRPRFSWTIQEDDSIAVETIDTPKAVNLWQASNPNARDFRLTTIGASWASSPLTNQGGGLYLTQVPQPDTGWTAFFVELVYSNAFSREYSPNGEYDYHFTTEVHVVPKAMPYPEVLIAPVYRFWSPVTGKHFLTMAESEKAKLIDTYPETWTYEGVAWHAYLTDCNWGLKAVHRFWSDTLTTHFYTISESEKQKLITTYSHIWTYEGVASYVYPEGDHPPEALPVHRFWSSRQGSHFYTASETEKDKLVDRYSNTWAYEGIAWYALARD